MNNFYDLQKGGYPFNDYRMPFSKKVNFGESFDDDEIYVPRKTFVYDESFDSGLIPAESQLADGYEDEDFVDQVDEELPSIDYGDVPEVFAQLLYKNGFLTPPRKALYSPFDNYKRPGESAAFIYKDTLIYTWRVQGMDSFTFVTFEDGEITDFAVEYDSEEDTGLLSLYLETEARGFALWFEEYLLDEMNDFITEWSHLCSLRQLDSPLNINEVMNYQELEKTPNSVIFGAFMLLCLSDENGALTTTAHEKLEGLIANPNLFLLCIEYIEEKTLEDLTKEVKDNFARDQILMTFSNILEVAVLADLDSDEKVESLLKTGVELDLTSNEIINILNLLRLKNSVEILEIPS